MRVEQLKIRVSPANDAYKQGASFCFVRKEDSVISGCRNEFPKRRLLIRLNCFCLYTHTAYRNHNGHYEVVLVEYDPTKTSYEVLVQYAYRNMDVFDGAGQFCDKGRSYKPAIFYETEEEFGIAQDVLGEILEQKDWQLEDIAAPILKRPKFWIGT